MNPPVVLTIAATDSGGGAGIAADLTTFAALGVHGACAVTAVTAQDTTAVHRIHPVPIEVLQAQLAAVFTDLPVAAVKTGMLGSVAAVELVARTLTERGAGLPLVIDPVFGASTGASFADDSVIEAYRDLLLPLATVVTPNADEIDLLGLLTVTVIRTGSETGTDVLLTPGQPPARFPHDRVETSNDHGTGCTYSSALAAYLALGRPLPDAADRAGRFTAAQLRRSKSWSLGAGRGPIAHLQANHTGENR